MHVKQILCSLRTDPWFFCVFGHILFSSAKRACLFIRVVAKCTIPFSVVLAIFGENWILDGHSLSLLQVWTVLANMPNLRHDIHCWVSYILDNLYWRVKGQISKSKHYKGDFYMRKTLLTCASSEDSNQPANPSSLFRVFSVRMMNLWILGYPNCAQWRF